MLVSKPVGWKWNWASRSDDGKFLELLDELSKSHDYKNITPAENNKVYYQERTFIAVSKTVETP